VPLGIGTIRPGNRLGATAEIVISTDPAPGERVASETPVNVVYHRPPRPIDCTTNRFLCDILGTITVNGTVNGLALDETIRRNVTPVGPIIGPVGPGPVIINPP
jgi:hypothetical protein